MSEGMTWTAVLTGLSLLSVCVVNDYYAGSVMFEPCRRRATNQQQFERKRMIEWSREMPEGLWLVHFEPHESRKYVAVRYTEKLCGESYLG